MIRAFIFDLYGTLLETTAPPAHRRLPRLLGISGREWIRFVREELMTRSFETREEFARYLCSTLAPDGGEALVRQCLDVLVAEEQSAVPFQGAVTLLSFLKHRDYKLGLVSNLSSSHKEPLETTGLISQFDALFLSCDEGIIKPDPAVFAAITERLGVAPSEAVMVGDSYQNDVAAARAAGLLAVGVGADRDGWIPDVARLGLLSFDDLSPLLDPSESASIDEIEAVPDSDQGSYNLVYRVSQDGQTRYLKRFALPESAAVEELAYRLQRETGLGTCRARTIGSREPLLLIDQAAGEKWPGKIDPEISYEIGRHMTFAFIFSNADARPRNAFLSWNDGRPHIDMIDLEHCFFDLAIDTDGIDDPFDPDALMKTPALEERIRKRVLTERATRRARRTFLKEEEHGQHNLEAFGRGWCDYYHHLKSEKGRIIQMLRERVRRKPYLIIGTRSYRRAMAEIDVEYISRRLDESPEENFIRYQ